MIGIFFEVQPARTQQLCQQLRAKMDLRAEAPTGNGEPAPDRHFGRTVSDKVVFMSTIIGLSGQGSTLAPD
jgi:hypothetical protein